MIREYIIKVSGEKTGEDEDMLDGFPELIRCKDCKNREIKFCPLNWISSALNWKPDDNWFCAEGERKTE